MAALLGAKHYELATGHLIFAGARPKLSKFSARMVFLFGTAIPLYVRWQAGRAYAAVKAWMHWAVAHGVLRVEKWLESILENVREKTAPAREPGEASAFLREVGEYKKKLTDNAVGNRIDQ
jgi:hypothetical protein